MNEKILLKFIFDLLEENNKVGNKVYNFLSQYLTEESHSFGFKPLDDLELEILTKLDNLYQNDVTYYKYERFYSFKKMKNKSNFFIKLHKKSHTKELFFIIVDTFNKLEKISKTHGKAFSKFTEDEDISPSILFDFQPIYRLMDKFILKFDREVIGNINGVDCVEYRDDYGIMYNYILSKIIINGKKIENKHQLYNTLINENIV